MRKAAGLLFATSLLLPVGLMTASPAASAAAKGPTCKTFVATVTNTPALPKIGVATKVNSLVKTTGKIGGCTGGPVAGVTSATVAASYKYNGNCTTFATGKGGVTTNSTSSIKWSNGKTSTTTSTIKLISKVGVTPLMLSLTTKITKGQYVGASSTGKVKGTSVAGACTKVALSKSTLTGVGAFTFK
jgi:hypothetical protein